MALRQYGAVSHAGVMYCMGYWLFFLLPICFSHVRQATAHKHLLKHISQQLVDVITARRHIHQSLMSSALIQTETNLYNTQSKNTEHIKPLALNTRPTGNMTWLAKTKRGWSQLNTSDTSDTDALPIDLPPASHLDIHNSNASVPLYSDTLIMLFRRRLMLQQQQYDQQRYEGHKDNGPGIQGDDELEVNKRIIGTSKLAIGLDLHTLTARLHSYRRHFYEDRMKDARDRLHNLGRR
jgi:hypothetical protein